MFKSQAVRLETVTATFESLAVIDWTIFLKRASGRSVFFVMNYHIQTSSSEAGNRHGCL